MNITPIVARHVISKKSSRGTSSGDVDVLAIFMLILVCILFAIILVLLIGNMFAEVEVVETTSMTVVTLTEDTVPKYDEFFVTLSDGNTYEISRYVYSSLTVGDVVEFSQIVKHTFLGDIPGYEISGEFRPY